MGSARLSTIIFTAAGLSFLLFATFFLGHKPSDAYQPSTNPSGKQGDLPEVAGYAQTLLPQLQVLQDLRLSPYFDYRRQCIRAKRKKGLERTSLTNVSRPFFEGLATRTSLQELNDRSRVESAACSNPIAIDVPNFVPNERIHTPHIIFGAATLLGRVEGSLPEISRWIANTGSRLVVVVTDVSDLTKSGVVRAAVAGIEDKARDLNIDLVLSPYSHSSDTEAQKNFGIARAIWENRTPETQWYGIIDDDTFFLSLSELSSALSAYDTSKSFYIGALTERLFGIRNEGFKAWGGGGFFLSSPLMSTLYNNYMRCNQYDSLYGDLLWRDCILTTTSPTVKLTLMDGLNQLDFYQDPSGWYESGPTTLLSLHHWKSFHRYPVYAADMVSEVAGSDTLLARYLFSDELLVANGYSILSHPQGLPDLMRVEATMVHLPEIDYHEKHQWAHSLGDTRPKLTEGVQKISWRFETAARTGDGKGLRQFYVKRRMYKSDEKRKGWDGWIDSVIEVEWRAA